MSDLKSSTIGWIGTGRMGFPMAEHLVKAGADVAAYNRTRAKAEPLGKAGAKIVNKPAELASRDIVFTMVTADKDLLAVTTGPDGVLGHRTTRRKSWSIVRLCRTRFRPKCAPQQRSAAPRCWRRRSAATARR